jgi:hypothetical protein
MAMNFPDWHVEMHIRISPDIQLVINVPGPGVDSVLLSTASPTFVALE